MRSLLPLSVYVMNLFCIVFNSNLPLLMYHLKQIPRWVIYFPLWFRYFILLSLGANV